MVEGMTHDNGHSEFGYLQSDKPIQRREEDQLKREPLADLIGGEERLKERIGQLASHRSDEELDERTKLALDAAERYTKESFRRRTGTTNELAAR
jgi:hypothetical protein